MHAMTRKQFLQTIVGAAGVVAVANFSTATGISKSGIKLGVTLYSYTGEYGVTTLLEDSVASAAAMGAEGIELLSETHIPDYPNPSDNWIKRWRGLMDKYRTRPSCFDCRVDSRLRSAAALTTQESLDIFIRDIKLANSLGFKIIRPAWGVEGQGRPAPSWRDRVPKALPYAEKHEVAMVLELQSMPAVDACVELIAKTGTKHLGLLVDTGMPEVDSGSTASREPANRFSKLILENPKAFLPYIPYTLHVRGRFHGSYLFNSENKCWEIAQGLQRDNMAFGKLIPLLIRSGYQGYISSEYEGPHSVMMASNHLSMQHSQLRNAFEQA